MSDVTWPVQGSGAYWLGAERAKRNGAKMPCRCSDADARRAYDDYRRQYGDHPSTKEARERWGGDKEAGFQRLMERGGFGPGEMDEHAPGWTRLEK